MGNRQNRYGPGRAEEIEAAYRQLESVANSITHDLRSPLSAIQGFVLELQLSCETLRSLVAGEDLPTALRAELSPILEQDIPEALEYIGRGASRIAGMINGVVQALPDIAAQADLSSDCSDREGLPGTPGSV